MPSTLPIPLVATAPAQRNDRVILDRVDWTVGAGEHWIILGPNGCGKTSLINCLTGYECPPREKSRSMAPRIGRTDWREVRKRVGLVTSARTFYLEPGEPVLDVRWSAGVRR